MNQFETPILYLMFNRLDLVKHTFPRIKEIKPKYLYVAADGPREGNHGDLIKCKECREWVLNEIDWDCELKTLFRNQNLGCGLAPSSAITWLFENEEMGIILEDDCLANKSFFEFCRIILARYKDNPRIMHISGLNWQNGRKRGASSYYFSKYPGIWGWATWRDRWNKFDFNLDTIDKFIRNNKIQDVTSNKKEQAIHIDSFIRARNMTRNLHIWDYQWKYTIFNNSGICITPNYNLISNIGFGEDATHTKKITWRFKNKSFPMDFPLKHPKRISIHSKADKYTAERIFLNTPSIIAKFIFQLKRVIKFLGARLSRGN